MTLVEFNPMAVVLWAFITAFIPGAILALGLLRKSALAVWERIGVGFAIGIVGSAAIPFVLYLVAQVPYSFALAQATTAIFYLLALALFIRSKAYEDLKLPSAWNPQPSRNDPRSASGSNPGSVPGSDPGSDPGLANAICAVLLLLVVVLSFWIRLQPYSPIFYELDPYFYVYSSAQLITQGEMPFSDNTGWYPLERSHHRLVPLYSYLNAIWYSFYTSGGAYSHYLLADVANVYPPLIAALSVFLLYLAVQAHYGREAGLLAAAMASFAPMYLTKTLAGEIETQPYSFFAIAFFMAMYVLLLKSRSRSMAILAGLAYSAAVLGSESEPVLRSALVIFIPIQGLLLFLKQKSEDIRSFLTLNSIVLVLGPVLGLATRYFFVSGIIPLSLFIIPLFLLGFLALLYFLRDRLADVEIRTYALALMILAGFATVLFTPLGTPVQDMVRSQLSVATFGTALQRTIAEQGTSAASLEPELGFLAANLPREGVLGLLPNAISFIVNFILRTFLAVLDALFQTGVVYSDTTPSVLSVMLLLFFLFILYELYQTYKEGRDVPVLLFFGLLFPPSLIGILKAKFSIYAAFLLSGAAGIVIGNLIRLWRGYAEQAAAAAKGSSDWLIAGRWLPLLAVLLLGGAQYVFTPLPHALLQGSFTPRFQDNPLAVQPKLVQICDQIKLQGGGDSQICGAAQDPLGYASQGTNYQFDTRLCYISLSPTAKLFSNEPLSESELWAIRFRCSRINDYWIETMDWIANSTGPDARITSWWDYGHWTNFFGDRGTVLRNDHASPPMIGEVAHDYISGTPSELIAFMKAHSSQYALFDQEILFQGSSGNRVPGGKYGALNYLACAHNNRATVGQGTGSSACEAEHLWEALYVPRSPSADQACVISESALLNGTIGYELFPTLLPDGSVQNQAVPVYCVGQQPLADGTQVQLSYYLDRKDSDGNLQVNKALLVPYGSDGAVDVFALLYTYDKLWIENGAVVDGYSDHKGKFYESNLYRAFVLEDLPGFRLVFKSRNGEVKIFKIDEPG